MKNEITTYSCDKCGRRLKTCDNEMDIVTSISEASCWSRLHLKIYYTHGMHNDSTTEPAALCKTCAVELLRDALRRVHKGERTTAGVNSSDQEGWN
jgi:hypothetical protein